jgi:hypothetical protein
MTYMGSRYHPWWLDNLADDATSEGEAELVVVNHRPRSSVLLFARLMGEKFAGTPFAEHFITDGS